MHTYLNEADRSKLLQDIRIGVIKGTTTYDQFELIKNKKNPKEKYEYKYFPEDSRYDALNKLDRREYDAYASDVPILQTILEQAYRYRGYRIFPEAQNEYLPGLSKQEYGQEYGIAYSGSHSC